MHVVRARNINGAYRLGLTYLRRVGELSSSRAGDVLVAPEPVTTVYQRPMERVLFCPNRDANPYFSLAEALWMLAGRNDAVWLDRFVKDFSSRFAEDYGFQHGAYGFRWRKHFEMEGGGHDKLPDQLDLIVDLLKKDPNDRRIVLTMWDPVADLGVPVKDVPCNTHVYARIRGAVEEINMSHRGYLDLTVCCRSNDAVWGAYGSNAVHFSILQEYLAARIGVGVGTYYQVSNNFHRYTGVKDVGEPSSYDPYGEQICTPSQQVLITPIVTDPEMFDTELDVFLGSLDADKAYDQVYSNKFFPDIAWPMFKAYELWRAREFVEARRMLNVMPPNYDWTVAAAQWMDRRTTKRKATAHGKS